MELLLAFAITLLAASLISGLAHRTVLSTAVLFLVAGFVLGNGVTGIVPLEPGEPIVTTISELALFAVLFTDGQRLGVRQLRAAWRLPGRALLLGMPLTFVVATVLAVLVAGLSWPDAMLVAAVLAPTDPVFASAIVGRPEVPRPVRRLLGVESGVNDGLALPVVLVLIAVDGGPDVELGSLAIELGLGIAIGVVVPLLASLLLRLKFFSATATYTALIPVAIGLIVLGLASLTDANLYLAAFAAGITIASVSPELRDAFNEFGELVAELLKLVAILVFGTLISPMLLAGVPVVGYVLAVLLIVVARPVAIMVSLLGSRLNRGERLTAAWFGPKGFASVLYGLLVLNSGIANADDLFHLIVVCILISILAHSSTDVPIANAFGRMEEASSHSSDAADAGDEGRAGAGAGAGAGGAGAGAGAGDAGDADDASGLDSAADDAADEADLESGERPSPDRGP